MNLKELERKAKKAIRYKNKIWTIEEIRFAKAKAKIWADMFHYGRYETLISVLNKLIINKSRLE